MGSGDSDNGLRSRVVAFDPGGTTGWCAMEYRRGAGRDGVLKWTTGSIVGHALDGAGLVEATVAMAEVAWRFLGRWCGGVDGGGRLGAVVIEDFVLDRARASGKRDLLSPVRLTAGFRVELAWLQVPWPVVLQSPADAKSVVTNDRLKRWGYWVQGSTHERDAVRHALLYVRRS